MQVATLCLVSPSQSGSLNYFRSYVDVFLLIGLRGLNLDGFGLILSLVALLVTLWAYS